MDSKKEKIEIIDGVEVRFPYTPYDCQKTYMEAVIKSVKNGENAILESPTGTGKTLSLLCSTLACLWHARFKDDSAFKPKIAGSSREVSLLTTMHDLRNQINVTAKAIKNQKVPKLRIIYASRTHSQLKQVVREATKSSYTDEFTARGLTSVVLGSRDQLCIHPRRGSLTGEALNAFCNNMIQHQGCMYHNNLKKGKGNSKIQFYEFMDIEDLVSVGKAQRCCPFYASRDAHEDADVTLLPYNYLFSPMSRDAVDIKLQNSVLIIDEAHNVEGVAESAAGFSISHAELESYMHTLKRVINAYTTIQRCADDVKPKSEIVTTDIRTLTRCLKQLKSLALFTYRLVLSPEALNSNISLKDVTSWTIDTIRRKHMVLKGSEMLKYLMDTMEFGELRNMRIDTIIKSCIVGLSSLVDDPEGIYHDLYGNKKEIQEDIQVLISLLSFFQHIFSKELQACPEYFNAIITEDPMYNSQEKTDKKANSPSHTTSDKSVSFGGVHLDTRKSNTQQVSTQTDERAPKVLTFECLQSTPSFLRLMNEGIRCMILTSGTLSPISDLEKSIGGNKILFENKLCNDHVVPSSHVCALTIRGTKTDNGVLSCNYATRLTDNYVRALGETLVTFLRTVPSGVLVFFGSYPVMEKTIKMWDRMGLYARMRQEKTMFVETKGDSQPATWQQNTNTPSPNIGESTQNQLKEYNKLVSEGHGCAFIGVCRGKIAEGIDFTDDACRGVFLCGVPYPNIYEDRVSLKMDYLRKLDTSKSGEGDADDWYMAQAIRAVNQAVGRAIRHINDYGVIMLADSKFNTPKIRKGLSQWVQRDIKRSEYIEECMDDMNEFLARFSVKHKKNRISEREIPDFGCNIFADIMNSLSQKSDDCDLKFKSRKLGPKPDSMMASSLRAGPQIKSFSSGFMTKPSGSASTTPPSTQSFESTQSSWEVVDSWSNKKDATPLAEFKKQ
ncbi:DNA repair DEAD helicase rad3/xp-d subfamily protein [Babesia gibsoni]|uniref:DNA repair DEAD helicase rad3/xp-d subfamily protein n=1 Tax=Babesia gibsoni TaxID=33632 RepID=A0AAD8PH03_BABGI|nr:DNA repair DEAD helicase rad3/xp-d subfamily protein [Babesia gibsoni]